MKFGSNSLEDKCSMDDYQRSLLFADITNTYTGKKSKHKESKHKALYEEIKSELTIKNSSIDVNKAAEFLTVLEIFAQENTELISFLPANRAGGTYIPPELISKLTNYSLEDIEKYTAYFFGARSLQFDITLPTSLEIN